MKNIFKFAEALFLVTVISCKLAFSQEVKNPKELSKCVCEAKIVDAACLEELKNAYFSRPQIKSEGGIPPEAGKDNKYSEFTEALKSLCPDNKTAQPYINYYIALTRYSQLKYLEENKSWDEYFAKGNDYRNDIVNSAQKAMFATTSKDAVNVYAKLLTYQFHKDQQDTSSDSALADLMSAIPEYAQGNNDTKIISYIFRRNR